MPSIHSTELLLILVVALLVIGPERLPAAIRTASLWMGRFRRSFYKVKSEIERELNADEVRRQLHNESVLADLRDTKSEVQKAAGEARSSVNKIVNSKNFDPGASPATDEQLRNAEAERKAAATGGGADQDSEDAAADPASDAPQAAGNETQPAAAIDPQQTDSGASADAAAGENSGAAHDTATEPVK